MAPASRLIGATKLLLLCALYCYLSHADQHRPISNLAQALVYHKYQPTPLLSRANRQPHTLQYQPQNVTADSYLQGYPTVAQGNYNRQQQHQARQEPQISYLRDSSDDEEDSYGCPAECHCNKIAQIADCSNRNLTRVPNSFPKDIKRIRLERNNISEIGAYAFQGLKRLQRIDLSNNNLQKIDTLAFSGGLPALNSLILYSNKLEYLPASVFGELAQLQLLLLNANSLQTIHRDLFQSLANLNLLSLYDNNIVTLTSGTFDGLRSIKTIHLGKNPLNCDCNLRWLVEYFGTNPTVETSEARCESPWREQGKKLSQLNKSELKCQEQPIKATVATPPLPAQDPVDQLAAACPNGCVCNGVTVDCSRAPLGQLTSESRTGTNFGGGLYELPDVPDDLPVYVARVHINDNRIKRIRQTSLFRKLANSQKLDLGNNKIVDVEDNAINGQLPNGQKPERVIFVLLENQHCEAPPANSRGGQSGDSSETGPVTSGFRSASPMNGGGSSARQQPPEPVNEDPCAAAPKVNEPQFDSPCYNGGTCRASVAKGAAATSAGNFSCLCPVGFGGPLCEINLDDCVDHQCQNGAMCVDGINSYKCICRDPTTSGEFCEQLNSSNNNNNNNHLFNPPYATSSANSIAPLALPIIAQSAAPAAAAVAVATAAHTNELAHNNQPQILARSADMRAPEDLAANTLQVAPGGKASGVVSSSCHKVTTSRYFDDGNGCQSVRLLKMSECVGGCSDPSSGGGCCAPTKIKRRRIHMQCSDGASYVKVIDLVKKCSCSQDVASCPANNELPFVVSATAAATVTTPASMAPRTTAGQAATESAKYFKYTTGGDNGETDEYQRRRDRPSAPSRQRQSYNKDQDALLRLDAVE